MWGDSKKLKCNKIHFLIPLRVIIDIWFHLYLNTNTFDLKIWAFIRVHILYGRWIQFEMEVQDFLPIYLRCIKFWGGFCSKSSSKSLLTNTYTSFSMKQVKGKKFTEIIKVKLSKRDCTEEFSFGFISIIVALQCHFDEK